MTHENNQLMNLSGPADFPSIAFDISSREKFELSSSNIIPNSSFS